MSGWITESTDGVWIFRHPDGRRIEALPNRKVKNETVTRLSIAAALDTLDSTAARIAAFEATP